MSAKKFDDDCIVAEIVNDGVLIPVEEMTDEEICENFALVAENVNGVLDMLETQQGEINYLQENVKWLLAQVNLLSQERFHLSETEVLKSEPLEK